MACRATRGRIPRERVAAAIALHQAQHIGSESWHIKPLMSCASAQNSPRSGSPAKNIQLILKPDGCTWFTPDNPKSPRANWSRLIYTTTMTEVEPKIAFDHLYQTLVEYQARFVDVGMKGAGLAVLLLGWLLTSKEARAFIAAGVIARCAAVAGTSLMAAAGVLLFGRISHGMRH